MPVLFSSQTCGQLGEALALNWKTRSLARGVGQRTISRGAIFQSDIAQHISWILLQGDVCPYT